MESLLLQGSSVQRRGVVGVKLDGIGASVNLHGLFPDQRLVVIGRGDQQVISSGWHTGEGSSARGISADGRGDAGLDGVICLLAVGLPGSADANVAVLDVDVFAAADVGDADGGCPAMGAPVQCRGSRRQR